MTSVFLYNKVKPHLLTQCISIMAATLEGARGCGLGCSCHVDAEAPWYKAMVKALAMVVTMSQAMVWTQPLP